MYDIKIKILDDLDIAALRIHFKTPDMGKFLALVIMHKVRYEATAISDEKRHESRAWLKEHGMGRISGIPFPDDGSLPQ